MSGKMFDDRLSDKTKEEEQRPEIYAVNTNETSRRSFIGAALTGMAAIGASQVTAGDSGSSGFVRIGGNFSENSTDTTKAVYGVSCGDLKAHGDAVNSLLFSTDGKTMISGSADKSIKLWMIPSGTMTKKITGHTAGINTLALDPRGQILLSAGDDMNVQIWSLPSGVSQKTLKGHSDSINSLSCNDNGNILVSGGKDRNVLVWQLPGGKLNCTLQGHTKSVRKVIITIDNLLATLGFDNTIRLWNLTDGKLVKVLDGHVDSSMTSMAYDKDRKLLVATGTDNILVSWQLPEGKLSRMIKQKALAPSSEFYINPDNSLCATNDQNIITIANWPDCIEIKKFGNIGGYNVSSLAFSPDNTLIAAGYSNGAIMLWNLPDGDVNRCLYDSALVETGTGTSKYSQQGSTMSDTTCTCNTVCTCNTITVPAGTTIPSGVICTCNTVSVGSKARPSSGYSCSSCGSCGGSYWYPN